MDLPELGTLTRDPFGALVSDPRPVAAVGGEPCTFVLSGYEDDPHPEDFRVAVRNMLAADARLLQDASAYVHQYCLDMLQLDGDDAPPLQLDAPADVWRYVRLGSVLVVARDRDECRDVFVSLECNCEWEVEHGLQLVFANGLQISKVGGYDGHMSNESAFDDAGLRGVVYKGL